MILERAQTIIEIIQYITVATVCDDGTPWNTPVYTAYDDDLNFYWASWTENQHSKNIEHNRNVFCVIYDSRAAEGTGEGLYMQGRARALNAENQNIIIKGLDALNRRVVTYDGYSKYDPFITGQPSKIFQFTPEKCWMNDGATKDGEYIDIRQEIDLNALKEEVKSRYEIL